MTGRYGITGVISEDDQELLEVVVHAICSPRTIDMLTPILASVPLQLLACPVARPYLWCLVRTAGERGARGPRR